MIFSIITACWNDFPRLMATSESISNQTCQEYEWIIIDGGSVDRTAEWLNKGFNHNGFWVSEKDAGIYDAMNKGIDRASGEYLIFMNAGDSFASRTVLEKVLGQMPENKAALIYGDSIDIKNDGGELYRTSRTIDHIPKGMMTQHQAMFFRSNFFDTWRYPEIYKWAGDYALLCSFYKCYPITEFYYLKFPVCKFLLGGAHDFNRLLALKEDFHIRRNVLGLSRAVSCFLYLAHYGLHILKRLTPSLMFKFRYSNQHLNS